MPPPETPGVYVEEIGAFPPTVVEVPTSVAAFVGYTETAVRDGVALAGRPFRVGSMVEFEAAFGGAARPRLRVAALPAGAGLAGDDVVVVAGQGYRLAPATPTFRLHAAIRHFFLNGGGPCWIVSVGGHDAPGVEAAALSRGLQALAAEAEPALVVIPDAVELAPDACSALQAQMLAHCAAANRFAILDVPGGDRPRSGPGGDPVAAFRDGIGAEHLSYGAAYYPWVRTNLVAGADLSAEDFETEGVDVAALLATSAELRTAAARRLNLMPPSGGVAGLYARVDTARGVWKAPANESLNGVIAPAVALDAHDQEDLNTPLSGRAVNAIRPFPGRGVLVWGARTLDGASTDWRYISVRRTCLMIEESVRLALQPLVFEPNAAPTWVVAQAMIENVLTTLWRQGGLMGVKPEQAFAVRCGLGQTMTQADLDGGVLRVEVMLALVRPAEFVVLTFAQQMQAG